MTKKKPQQNYMIARENYLIKPEEKGSVGNKEIGVPVL